MVTTSNETEHDGRKSRPIIELPAEDAKKFFLKHDNYFTTLVPEYIHFADLLNEVDQALVSRPLPRPRQRTAKQNPRSFDDVNHRIMSSKDGRYAWRPLEIIHPALYVSLVSDITESSRWKFICERFHHFDRSDKIECISIPVESLTDNKDTPEQIVHWLEKVEQRSIELSLYYEFLVKTDIVDCYGAIYTHSIAWALHDKATAKQKRNDSTLLGNIIDSRIQDMRYGQTNGIPQGSKLMDLIGEMVLGYADTMLADEIARYKIKDYHILRYRDDYRIFVNNPYDGERIMKCLTEVMIDLGFKLGAEKTNASSDVIASSIKADKLGWMLRKQWDNNLQNHLLIVHNHSMEHPNAGSIRKLMNNYMYRFDNIEKGTPIAPLIAIVVDIAYRNPATYPMSAAILSKLFNYLDTETDKIGIIKQIQRKFLQIPNTGYMDLWLQRISHRYAPDIEFDEVLCKKVQQDSAAVLWNIDWIDDSNLLAAIANTDVVDFDKLNNMPEIMSHAEVALFNSDYYP